MVPPKTHSNTLSQQQEHIEGTFLRGQVTFEPGASFGASTGAGAPSASRAVGFRYFALVTGNDTDPAYVARAGLEEGTDSQAPKRGRSDDAADARGGAGARACSFWFGWAAAREMDLFQGQEPLPA